MNYITLQDLRDKIKTQGAQEVFIEEGLGIENLDPQSTPSDIYFALREISNRLKSGEDIQYDDPIFDSLLLALNQFLDESV